MQFNELIIEGLGSIIEKTIFNLDRPGINILRGKIGSGKTTILSSFFWCLFGEKLKEKSTINTWEEIQPENYKGTKVEIKFTIGKDKYNIIRCENYKKKIENKKGGNNIFIYKNNQLSKTKGKRNQQSEIENIIGYSSDLFKNAIIFGQKLKRIIEETGPKKKKIFEEAFDVQYIQTALDNVKNDLKENKTSLDRSLNIVDKNKSSRKIEKVLYKTQKKSEKTFQENKLKNLDRISKDMIELNKKHKKILSKVEGIVLPDIKSNQTKILFEKTSLKENNRKIYEAESNIKITEKNLENLKSKKCKQCGNKIKPKNQKILINKSKKELKVYKKTLKKLKSYSVEKVENRIKSYDNNIALIRGFEKNSKKLKKVKKKINKKNNEFIKEKSTKLEIKSKNTKNHIQEYRKTIKEERNKIKSLKSSINILEWMIKDPLSNSGIKAYILDELITKVNDVLESYSSILGYLITFEIDMESSQKDFKQYIEREKGHIVEYFDLSGGQRQLVDTSVAIAIHEVISNIKPSNIIFMDEPFESLDKDSVEIISELLKNKPIDKSIFIITHQLSFNPLNSNTISLQLNNEGHTLIG